MKCFEYCYLGDSLLIGGRQYRAGELLVSYMNLNIERLDALYSACLSQKNALTRFERSEEYSRVIRRSADTFDVIDKLFSKLPPCNRLEGENTTLASVMEKSSLFRGFDVISSQPEEVQAWQEACGRLSDMYLSALDGLKFCRDTAAVFLTSLEESGEEQAFEAIGADSIELSSNKERITKARFAGEVKLCVGGVCESFLDFVRTVFAIALYAEVKPRPCGCCGKYFLPSNRLAKFCDRKAPDGSGKLCREIGARKRYEKKQKDNPISKIYSRAYKARYARMTAGKLTRDEMAQWTEKATELRAKALSENTNCEEFERQLKTL